MKKEEVLNDDCGKYLRTGRCKSADDSCSQKALEGMGRPCPDTRGKNQCHGSETDGAGAEIQCYRNPEKDLCRHSQFQQWCIKEHTPIPSKRTTQLITALTTEVKSWSNSRIKTGMADPAPRVAHPEKTMNMADERNATVFFHRGQLSGSLGSSVA